MNKHSYNITIHIIKSNTIILLIRKNITKKNLIKYIKIVLNTTNLSLIAECLDIEKRNYLIPYKIKVISNTEILVTKWHRNICNWLNGERIVFLISIDPPIRITEANKIRILKERDELVKDTL